MRKDITVTASARDTRGKNEARRLRVKGFSPAVVYGAGVDPVAIAVDPKEINQILRSASSFNTIFNVDVQGQLAPVIIKDWQLDPIKSTLLHVDLKRVDLSKPIVIKVPVHTKGDPKGVKIQGGLHEIINREIEIECLPDEIPEEFTVDVTDLSIGQSVRAGEIPLSGSMKLVSPPDSVISHVIAVRTSPAEEETAAAAATTAEPEVIKKGKKEEAAATPAPEEKKKK